MSRRTAPRVRALVPAVVLAVAVAGCGTSSSPDRADPDTAPGEVTSQPAAEPTGGETGSPGAGQGAPLDAPPVPQEETCDWDSPAVTAPAEAPEGENGELSAVLVGAWQHTHFDTGSGYEAVTKDLRYVFPSTERVLYCQHVPGVTDHAENAVDFVLDGTAIELPGGAPGFVVSSWDADSMVWINRSDDSRYLLHRR